MVDTANIIKLGDSIELLGFENADSKSMIILKKIIGNYTRSFTDKSQSFQKLILNLNLNGNNFELNGEAVDNGQSFVSNGTGDNLFVVLGTVLKNIESSLIK